MIQVQFSKLSEEAHQGSSAEELNVQRQSLWLNDRQPLHKLIEAVLQSRAAMQLGACLYLERGGVTPTVSNARSVIDLTGAFIT